MCLSLLGGDVEQVDRVYGGFAPECPWQVGPGQQGADALGNHTDLSFGDAVGLAGVRWGRLMYDFTVP